MTEQKNANNADDLFLSVEEAAKLMKIKVETVYTMLSDTGSQGGKPRNRFPKRLYVRLGSRVLFIKEKLLEWLLAGAEFEMNKPTIQETKKRKPVKRAKIKKESICNDEDIDSEVKSDNKYKRNPIRRVNDESVDL
jgi:excisionase family DNA binding protein